MGREVKRVPADFDWPLSKVWEGFLSPDKFDGVKCPQCKNGYSPRAQHLFDQWYGYVPFRPEDNGSIPLSPETPAVRAFAERNVKRYPQFYGVGEAAIRREARRLCGLWNGMWSHHVNADDVAALVEAGRLMDHTHTWDPGNRWQPKDPPVVPTPEQVNEWAILTMGHDALNASVVVRARCEREGVPVGCEHCEGHSNTEAYPGQRAEAEAWEPTEPPTGDGWQMWETVSEGSPVSPVFPSAEALAQWLTTVEGGRAAGPSRQPLSIEAARRFVGAGWAPSGVCGPGGVQDGVHWVGDL